MEQLFSSSYIFNYHMNFNIVIFFFQDIKKQLAKYHMLEIKANCGLCEIGLSF